MFFFLLLVDLIFYFITTNSHRQEVVSMLYTLVNSNKFFFSQEVVSMLYTLVNSFSHGQFTFFFIKHWHSMISISHSDYSNVLTIQIDFCFLKLYFSRRSLQNQIECSNYQLLIDISWVNKVIRIRH